MTTHSTQGQTAATQAKIWMGFLSYAIRRFWWLVAACAMIGGIWGYFSAMATPNRYEARASFVIPSEAAVVEYERIISRSLVTKAIHSQRKFEVSHYIDSGLRHRFEMYTGSPFQIRLIAFPDYLRNQTHHIKLFKDHSYELQIHMPETTLVARGSAGELISIGAVKLVVDATVYWNDIATEGDYSFVVHTGNALASRFLNNLTVHHSMEHPNRISLYYTDAHPALALDLLNAFTQAYLDDCKFRREEFLRERKRQVEGELHILETQILTSQDTGFWANLEKQSLLAQDSAVVKMLQLRKKTTMLEDRLRLWKEYLNGSLDVGRFELRAKSQGVPADSTLLHLFGDSKGTNGLVREKVLSLIATETDSLMQRDAAELAALEEEYLATHAEFLGAHRLGNARKMDWISKYPSTSSLRTILVESYLSGMAEVARIELETRQSFIAPQLIDPPYTVPGHGRGNKVRSLIGRIFGMALLGVFLALMASMVTKRFGSRIHFLAMSGLEEVQVWSLKEDDLAQRMQATQLELSLKKEDQVIALMGQTPEVDRVADSMAAGFVNFGKHVLVLNSAFGNAEVEWDRMSIPQSTQPGWWFSPQAQAFLKEKGATYDRILICLPPPSQTPEIAAAVRQAQLAYFVLQKNTTRAAEWRAWQAQAKGLGIEAKSLFIV
jgi:hypothetical protein